MSELSFRGGARIGWVNASWPFARLSIGRERLTLASLGSYHFTPEQVVSVERFGSIPFLSSGIRINHNRRDYPEKIVFWCMGRRECVLSEIERSGFSPKGRPVERASGFPIRWSAVISIVALWNALFLLDRSSAQADPSEPGPLVILALMLMFVFATAVRVSPPIRQVVLRPGHQIGEIKAFLTLVQIVTGFLSSVFVGMSLAHAYAG